MKFNLVKVGLGLLPLLSVAYAEEYTESAEGNNFDNEEKVAVYFYNANKNKCLRTTGSPESPVTYGTCDNSENTVWLIPYSHSGNYHSKVNYDYCLSIEDGNISLKECSANTILYRDGNFIKSPFSSDYCIGSAEKDPFKTSLKECDVNDPDQIWYFNIWDNAAVEDSPAVIIPDNITVYFYNAYKNKCLNSDLTLGDCDFNGASLWDIPISHYGYYTPKANPEKCLTVVDGVVSLSECNENTILYRDGNFIKSPSSDESCIVSSMFDNALEYTEGCDANNSDHIWYFNIYTPSEEAPETSVFDVPATSTAVEEKPTTVVEEKQTTVTVEKPTMTITTTVTAIMTEA